MAVAPDETKFAELLLYVAERLKEDPSGGSTKVNKALFAAEFAHMRRHGVPITGVEYQKLRHGPAPRRLLPIREALVARGDAEVTREDHLGYPLDRLVPRRPFRRELFSDEELKAVDEAIASLWSTTAVEASELSHREVGWRMVELGETIPYEAAYLAPAFEVTDSLVDHASSLAERFGL